MLIKIVLAIKDNQINITYIPISTVYCLKYYKTYLVFEFNYFSGYH